MTEACQRCRRMLLPVAWTLAGLAALCVDLPVAQVFHVWRNSKAASGHLGCFDIFEWFGHGLGVVLVVIVLHQLDPSRRWAIPRVAACAFAGGGLADLLKMLLARVRPHDFAFDGSVWTTFGHWLPALSAGSHGQSWPSAHTATATALASALIWLYPNGRRLFLALAVLVGCQRIVSGAHYPSDVLFGAAVGCVAAESFVYGDFLARRFEKWEAGWRAKQIANE